MPKALEKLLLYPWMQNDQYLYIFAYFHILCLAENLHGDNFENQVLTYEWLLDHLSWLLWMIWQFYKTCVTFDVHWTWPIWAVGIKSGLRGLHEFDTEFLHRKSGSHEMKMRKFAIIRRWQLKDQDFVVCPWNIK